MNKEKYPIKYAVLELKEEKGWIGSADYQNITRGFIVSKCYVKETSIKYLADGSNKISHEVVFPFRDLRTFKLALRNNSQDIGLRVNENDLHNIHPSLTNKVTCLFDSYEKAKEIAEKQNVILEDLTFNAARELNEPTIIKEFREDLTVCELFERLVLASTEDMEVILENSNKRQLRLRKSIDK